MSVAADVKRFQIKVASQTRDVFTGVVEESTRAIVEGSELTASPGQPVDTGRLKASWQTVFEAPDRAIIGTNVEYAQAVEDGVGPRGRVTYGKSGVGGSHSVKQLVANFDRVVEAVAERVKR